MWYNFKHKISLNIALGAFSLRRLKIPDVSWSRFAEKDAAIFDGMCGARRFHDTRS
jgi:hypothetical protein